MMFSLCASAQMPPGSMDTTVNNLIFPSGYRTVELGSIPEYKKIGKGKQAMVIIPGWGFEASDFDDFAEVNKKNYTLYIITIPGMGSTKSQPAPKPEVSYGELTWSKGVIAGIVKLLDKEKIKKATLLGHFTNGTYIALKTAIDHPDRIERVIALGGPARFVGVQGDKPMYDYPMNQMIAGVDKYWGPKVYKNITKSYFDANNYLPDLYSVGQPLAGQLWNKSASTNLTVMVHFLCEFYAADITLEAGAIKCPVLVLRPGFKGDLDSQPNYFKYQFVEAWDRMKSNPLVQIVTIPNAACFLWKDNPAETYKHIDDFMAKDKSAH